MMNRTVASKLTIGFWLVVALGLVLFGGSGLVSK